MPPEGDWLEWTLSDDVTGYRHWTFADEHETAIENTGVSYMMVRRLAIQAGRKRDYLEVAAGSQLAQLQQKLVEQRPLPEVTRRGVGIDSGAAASATAAAAGTSGAAAAEKSAEAASALDAEKRALAAAKQELVGGLPVAGVVAAGIKAAFRRISQHVSSEPLSFCCASTAFPSKTVVPFCVVPLDQAAAEPFQEPVPKAVPTYHELIAQPIALADMYVLTC
eukprot:SAG22_NODE_763_length_7406_cov_22.129054_8_plen_222_part_00